MPVYTSGVVGLAAFTGTPAEPVVVQYCRVITGGRLTIHHNNIEKEGIGSQYHSRKGTSRIELSGVNAVGVAKAEIQKFFPTTTAAQVAAFPQLFVECVDGRAWYLQDGQPGPSTLGCGAEEDSELEFDFSASFATATGAAAASATATYNAFLGHTVNNITVKAGGSDADVQAWSLANGITLVMNNPQNTKAATKKTLPDGYVITSYLPRLTIGSTKMHTEADDTKVLGDTHTAVDWTVTCANGTGAQDMLLTMTGWVPHGSAEVSLEGAAMQVFPSEWGPGDGTIHNRVVIS